MTTKYSRQHERQIRVEVFLPQDCIDFYLSKPTDSASRNIKKFLLKHWFENRGAEKKGDQEGQVVDGN
jgi:hypothetical protein